MRSPIAAGSFYPGDEAELKELIKRCFSSRLGPGKLRIKERLKAAIVPHAGYIFSGPAAAHIYARLTPRPVIILGTNHTGKGSGLDTSDQAWITPLGEMEIDRELRDKLKERIDIRVDESAHKDEHSIEVQLPFLQSIGFKRFLPISVSHLPRQKLKEFGDALKEMDALVIASSDFSHYVSQKVAEEIDLRAIELIEKGDGDRFLDFVERNHASICGSAPIASLLYAEKGRGKLIKYYTSGMVTGDSRSVVGYGAIGFK